jgi:hypothetical protein
MRTYVRGTITTKQPGVRYVVKETRTVPEDLGLSHPLSQQSTHIGALGALSSCPPIKQ